MATFTKVYDFVQQLGTKAHNLNTDVFKIALTDVAPTTATVSWSVGAFPAPTNTFGYAPGGSPITVTSLSNSAGVATFLASNDLVFTGTGGQLGPFRYAIMYNVTAGNLAVGWYDYTSSLTLNSQETFTIDFNQGTGIFTIT